MPWTCSSRPTSGVASGHSSCWPTSGVVSGHVSCWAGCQNGISFIHCIYVLFLSVLHLQNLINAVPKNPCCFQRVSLPVLTWHCSTGEDNMNVISSTTHPGQPSDSGVIFDGPTCQPVTAGSTIKPAMVSFLPCQFYNRQVCRHKEGSLYFAIVAASCSGTLVLVFTP